MIPLVFLDAGHGHLDRGHYVTAGKRYEDNRTRLYEGALNKVVAYHLAFRLSRDGIRSHIVNPYNFDMKLESRAASANRLGHGFSSLYLSIHHNAASTVHASGCELYTSIGDTGADPLAEHMARLFIEMFPSRRFRAHHRMKLSKEANFAVLRKTKMPAILTEFGFMTNAQDRAYISSPEGINDQVDWLYRSIVDFIKMGHL